MNLPMPGTDYDWDRPDQAQDARRQRLDGAAALRPRPRAGSDRRQLRRGPATAEPADVGVVSAAAARRRASRWWSSPPPAPSPATACSTGAPKARPSNWSTRARARTARPFPRAGWCPYDLGPIPSWRNLRFPRAQIPADAIAVRVVAEDLSLTPGDWVAVTPPRVPELRSVQEYVGSDQPVLMDWAVGLAFPCQQPMLHANGVTEIPKFRITPDYNAKRKDTDTWEDGLNGGLLGITDLLLRAHVMATYLSTRLGPRLGFAAQVRHHRRRRSPPARVRHRHPQRAVDARRDPHRAVTWRPHPARRRHAHARDRDPGRQPAGGGVPPDAAGSVAENADEFEPTFWNDDGWRIAMQVWVIEVDGLTVLVDTGVGNDRDRPRCRCWTIWRPTSSTLRRAGFDPGDVDVVVNTHLHFDHVGWNTMRAATRGCRRSPTRATWCRSPTTGTSVPTAPADLDAAAEERNRRSDTCERCSRTAFSRKSRSNCGPATISSASRCGFVPRPAIRRGLGGVAGRRQARGLRRRPDALPDPVAPAHDPCVVRRDSPRRR